MIKNFQLNKFKLRKYDLVIILGIYLISRIIIFNSLGFNNTPDFFHFSDKHLLQNDLLKTTLYLHSQPPLLNFFLGIFLKIFNGDLSKLSTLFYFLNTSLTVLILIIVRNIFKIYNLNQYLSLFILLFLTLNPNFIYYENYSHPIYSHIVCFLFFFLTYCLLKFCTKRKQKYENLTYITLTILSFIWTAWQPYLIVLIFFLIKIFFKNFNNKNFSYFIVIFIIALSPSIKNKILFNSFSNSSWSGIYLSTVFVPEPDCAKHAVIKKEDVEKAKITFNKKFFNEPSLWGPISYENNLAMIFKSKRCLKYAINRILNDPTDYLKNRAIQFVVSHSKFSFENVRGAPQTGKPVWIIKYLDKFDSKFKIQKQLLIFSFMIFVYFFFFIFIFKFRNNKKYMAFNFILAIIYSYYIAVTHLPNGGYETARMVYGGFVIQIIFLSNLFKLREISNK